MGIIRLAAAQTSEYREDIEGALSCAADFAHRAAIAGAKMLCFPEAFLQGYLTDEISARRVALDLSSSQFKHILKRLPHSGPVIVMGIIERLGGHFFNSAIVIENGRVIGRYRKRHLFGCGKSLHRRGRDTGVQSGRPEIWDKHLL